MSPVLGAGFAAVRVVIGCGVRPGVVCCSSARVQELEIGRCIDLRFGPA